MAFGDIPIRENGKDHIPTAEWWNTITYELLAAFGTGGYIVEQSLVTLDNGDIITFDPDAFKPMIPVVGNGGPVILSDTPFGTTHGFGGGKEIVLIGTSDTNTVTLEIDDSLDESVASKGKIILGKYDMVTLTYNALLKRFVRENP